MIALRLVRVRKKLHLIVVLPPCGALLEPRILCLQQRPTRGRDYVELESLFFTDPCREV
jgi:hypothetical protein